jgi:hypothetical protein
MNPAEESAIQDFLQVRYCRTACKTIFFFAYNCFLRWIVFACVCVALHLF